ncbi:TPA: hypothetical protein N0F65_010067 [Lagenidium giganteum]|uniref:RING-type domain-containing protein n=1 Tax=Lagenidium giganteum TaxID=4803 RepID=A0AAV2ZE09_9STRA|nr:TPA: hypothetical protein N0F65_010067 [Lagenidium giganteum]
MTCCQALQDSSCFERAYELADIRRAASLRDVRVQVNVAHTKSKLTARFFVDLTRRSERRWGFGVSMQDLKQFEDQMLHTIKTHTKSKPLSSAALPKPCTTCDFLRQQRKQWRKLSSFQAIGKHRLDEKCVVVLQFLYRLFRLLYTHAECVHECELLRKLLRLTEVLCRIEYENDKHAVRVIKSLKRLCARDLEHGEECSVCLGALNGPAPGSTLRATKGVELVCGHRFHDTCICMWFHTRLNCPVCRSTEAFDAVSIQMDAQTHTTGV